MRLDKHNFSTFAAGTGRQAGPLADASASCGRRAALIG